MDNNNNLSPSMMMNNNNNGMRLMNNNNQIYNNNNGLVLSPEQLVQYQQALQKQYLLANNTNQHNSPMGGVVYHSPTNNSTQQQQTNSNNTSNMGMSRVMPINTAQLNQRNYGQQTSLSFSPRFASMLSETKNTMYLSDNDFYPIANIFAQNYIKSSNVLAQLSEEELIQYGIPTTFARFLWKRFMLEKNNTVNKQQQQPQSTPSPQQSPNMNCDQGSNGSQSDADQQEKLSQLIMLTNVLGAQNVGNILMQHPHLISTASTSPSQHSNSTTSPIQQQQVVTPVSQNSSNSTNNQMNGLNSPNMNSKQLNSQQQQQNNIVNNLFAQIQQQQQLNQPNYVMTNNANNINNVNGVMNMPQLAYSSSFNNNLFDSVNHTDMFTTEPNSYSHENEFIAGTSLNSAVNSNSLGSGFLSSSTNSFQDIFGSTGSVMDVVMDHSGNRMGTSSSSIGSLLRNQDGSLPTSVSSGKSLFAGSMGSTQSSLHDDSMGHYIVQPNVNGLGFVRQMPTTSQTSYEHSSSSSSSTSPPGNSADHNMQHYATTSNNLGGLSPEMDMMEASMIGGTVSYPCRVKTEGQVYWPKVVSWYKREGDSEKELFTVIIANDSSSGKAGADKKKSKSGKPATITTSPPNTESQDLLLDFRNKYIRISLTEGGKDNLIKVERVGSQPQDDVWGFLITDTSKGIDFIDELKNLGFPEDSYTLSTVGTFPPQKQIMGFERLSTEQGGTVQAKQDDQILLMRFPRYAEPVKGIRKKKLLLIKYRFVHNECAYSFYSLFNLRKENHNAAMSTDDIWISSLFIEKDINNMSPMRPLQRSPVNPEPVPEVTRGSAKQKRTCDWETADANQLQFIANNPTVGKGGVDVVCKLDLSFEGNSMKRKFVADPSIESEMFLVEAEMSYDFIERGFFKIVRVVQQVDHVDLVVRMPRPTRETTTPQTIFFRILYNMKAILVNPQTKQQGKFTYEPIDKEELSNQATSKLLEFYQSYGSQFNDEVRRLIADKISNQIHNVTFDDMEGIHPKQYANLYVQFTELHYRVVTDESEMDEEEFINAVNSLGHESRDIYGFTLLTHYAFRGMKKHCRILMNRFGMSFENKDNLGVSVLEWCRLAHNPNNILELSYLEKSKTIPRHGIYTTSSPSIPIKQTKKDSTGSSPPNSTGTSPVRKSSWFSGIFRNIFTSPSQNQIYFDEDLTEEKESAQPLDMNVTSYDERLLSLEERQGMKLYLDKLKKLDEKISSKHGQGKSQEKSQAWKDLYLDENKTIEAQNAICKDRFVAKHYGKTMEHLSKKHKDERKPPLMTVKIIVSDCTNDFRNSLFDLFRPTYKDNLFGAFHTGLLIGPWRFDFYDHSIVRVRGDYRVYRNEYALAVIDVGSFSKVDNIKNALDTVASACVEWNATKTYDPFKCNCQHFVTDVLGRLNLWSDKPQTSPLSPFERYLEDLRKGRSERKFYFSDAIKSLKEQYPESSYWENDYITFNSRKELNDFCHWLDGMKYFENEESVSDIKLLKSFDRSFCMQSMNPEQEVSESDTSTVWFFSEDGTEFANSLNKLVFNLPGVTFPQALRV
ncbi:predicted protein [Naegleria gruberi]|uniref:Predicted protein n=1 Tax=Naegleria gruberi TaxID=5762 RepID=D2VPD4_NAEGR|nr:uncharacterized protein NAEGRDRAFT_58837 [Naegleria gruberi]EFC41412.1 predicted protein [Naegleria gruberi]|eukprot:XP_002674156.1 predicted protein [Naegleria gruberi strain NEG-M]